MVRRPLLLLIAAAAGVASVVILAADPKPSSRVTTQTADSQTAADLPAAGVADTPSDSSAAATQTSAQSVAVSSDPSVSSKSESSTTTTATATTSTTSTTTTTTLTPEPTPTSLAPEPLGVELVADSNTDADTNADTNTDADTNIAPATKADSKETSEEGQLYVWYDGDRTRRVRLQSDLTVQTGSDGQGDEIVARSAVTGTQAQGQALPVFRSESSGKLMTLPGGVLVVFDPELDDAQISKFLTEQGISKGRVSPMLLHNAFEIATEPGFPALELANQLATSAKSLVASPNWATDPVTK